MTWLGHPLPKSVLPACPESSSVFPIRLKEVQPGVEWLGSCSLSKLEDPQGAQTSDQKVGVSSEERTTSVSSLGWFHPRVHDGSRAETDRHGLHCHTDNGWEDKNASGTLS